MDREKEEKISKIVDYDSSTIEGDLDYISFKSLYKKLKNKYKISSADLLNSLEKKEFLIPSCIFNKTLSTLESICKYLKEDLNLHNKKIAYLIYRSNKSVWQAYNSSRKKFPKRFEISFSEYYIPLSILKDTKLSILESIVTYLKEEQTLNFHKIAVILKRDDRTIWTVYQRAKKKRGMI
jgi:hypothetical protein